MPFTVQVESVSRLAKPLNKAPTFAAQTSPDITKFKQFHEIYETRVSVFHRGMKT